MIFTATSPRTFTDAKKEHDCNQWDSPLYPQFRRLAPRMQSFSTWPVSPNQNADDLSEGGFFYRGNVFYKHKPFYYKKNIFTKSLLI